MSPAALPPIQPPIVAAERAHPRFREYMMHRAAMGGLLVQALCFQTWLRQTEERESPLEVVFEVKWRDIPASEKPPEALADGWWKNKFAPGHRLTGSYGPFDTKAEAEAA